MFARSLAILFLAFTTTLHAEIVRYILTSASPVTSTGISGFSADDEATREPGSNALLYGLEFDEKKDKPCYIKAYWWRHSNENIRQDFTTIFDVCNTTPKGDKKLVFNTTPSRRLAIDSIRVCSNSKDNHRMKGIKITAAAIDENESGIAADTNLALEFERPNCASWKRTQSCDPGQAAVGLLIEYNQDEITGLGLKCAKPIIRPKSTEVDTGEGAPSWLGRHYLETNLNWTSNRDLTSSEFSDLFDSYSDQSLVITDVDAYPEGRKNTQYAMIWHENPDGRRWKERRNLTSDGYHEKWEEYKEAGYRPLDIEVYLLDDEWRYAGIWIDNLENIDWWSRRNMDGDEYGTVFTDKSDEGYHLVDMEAYNTTDGLRYSAIWYKNVENIKWRQVRNMTRASYDSHVAEKNADGFVMVDYESYETDSGQRYAAIWEENISGRAWAVRTDRTEDEFANYWREYKDKGYRIIDFERYEMSGGGTRYGAIWAENNPERLLYDRKDELDEAIQDYLDEESTKGISAAIMKDGVIIYRRGFGWADKGRNKAAHGGTIYMLASISKTIGGTLTAKLEANGQLEDGTLVNLDLTRRTSTFLNDMPDHHTHTVEQLLSHLSCVPHYKTEPRISDTTKHYKNAQDALGRFWDKDLIKDCTVGVDSEYSTPAFTFVGAVLEEVTGTAIDVLVNEEIIEPYNLGTMKVMYEEEDLPENYERAKRYSGDVRLSGWPDNSWKVLGGGIESNAVDLARFGWKVLNGEIVSASVRDNRLWTKLNASRSVGLAWNIKTVNGRRTAEHGGVRIPVKPATQSGESGHPVGAKRRWGFHDVSGGRFESM